VSTTTLALTTPTRSHFERCNAQKEDRKLSVWTDHAGGARIYSPDEMKRRDEIPRRKSFTPDPFGHLNPNAAISEIVSVGQSIRLWVQAVTRRASKDRITVQVSTFTGEEPMLVVEARTLRAAFPDLEGVPTSHFAAKRVDNYPYLDPKITFESIVEATRTQARNLDTRVLLLERPVAPNRS